MILTPAVIDVPLRTDEGGVIRIGPTRVTLMTIVGRYQVGDTPESIHEGFPTVPLVDVYAVIAYYLAHHADVDAYMENVQTEHDRIRREWEATHPPGPTKAELLARLEAKSAQSGL